MNRLRGTGPRRRLFVHAVLVVALGAAEVGCSVAASPSLSPSTTAPPIAGVTPSVTPSASPGPTAATSHGPEVIRTEVVTIEPGKPVDLSIGFEGSDEKSIFILVEDASLVTAALDGIPLASDDAFGVTMLASGAIENDPAMLHLASTATTPIGVVVTVSIRTGRHLEIAGDIFAIVGEPLAVEVTLTEPDPTDTPAAEIVQADGSRVPVTFQPDGVGRWTGVGHPTQPGTPEIRAAVSGPRPRTARSLVTIADGSVRFEPGITARLVPADNPSQAGSDLVVTVRVHATVAGSHRVTAQLTDPSGMRVASGSAKATLDVGANAVELRFSGESIHSSGLAGPYRVTDAIISPTDDIRLEAMAETLGATDAYEPSEFAHWPIEIDGAAFSERLADADSDGLPDGLVVRGMVRVDTAGKYGIDATLHAGSSEVVRGRAVVDLVIGSNAFEIAFDGADIRSSGLDGPYVVRGLSVSPVTRSDDYGFLSSVPLTGTYRASDFE